MATLTSDDLHRTAKLELDEGRARTVDEAEEIVAGYVLQIDVGIGVSDSETRQAMLLTAVNTAARAFLGGVRVRLREHGRVAADWADGMEVATAVESFGGKVVESLARDHPTLVIGHVDARPVGSLVLHTTWEGWSGVVVEETNLRLAESIEFPLAGVLAASLGVSEAFQNLRGNPVAGRRSTGLSLWDPRCDWRDEAAYGEPCRYLPKRLWLIGLGHLGQAYAWALALLPYEDHSEVDVVLQDFDRIVRANESTGMLSDESHVGAKKTRIVSGRLEALGFDTTITERRFDSGTRRKVKEPSVALVGVDNPGPRRCLEGAGFDLVVDAGLGGGPKSYLEILIHSFPSGVAAASAWAERAEPSRNSLVNQPAYQDVGRRLTSTSQLTDEEIRCGIIEVAGRSAGAAFVGCVAATFVLAEVLRTLAGGPKIEVLGITLRSPHKPQVSMNTLESTPFNPGFVEARTTT